MKNIHIIPTDKPSRLVLETKNSNLFITSTYFKNDLMKYQNIYITSDEQIKDGDWVLYDKKYIRKVDKTFNKQNMDWNVLNTDKIILTTDPDLIKDGVQAIDDEFLEWFVKNPSCEYVEVKNYKYSEYPLNYKIIIPQEEHKQETLEEYAERLAKAEDLDNYKSLKELLIHIAEWQSKRMYSEEEVEQIFNIGQMIKNFLDYKPYTFKEALEQFKKTN